ncbi:hypothetical protein BKA64DRAFT_777242 [Cadophora sp. MPI-SDFR-AT-0126]|nr:hypothetical protein BKA64DRAFT_777242 [Leotiomycetes sp. MPI-SDFR-AT-0126]
MIQRTSLGRAIAIFALSSRASPSSLSTPNFPGNYALTMIQDIPGPQNLENVAVRYTGDLLATSTTSSSLFQHCAHWYYRIGTRYILCRLIEYDRDTAVPGSNAVWRVDMRAVRTAKNGTVSGAAQFTLVTKLPDAQLLNGLCRLAPNDNSNFLISDSVSGSVTKLNIHTGKSEIVIQDDTMKISQTGLPIGINGIHTHECDLFFVNLNQQFTLVEADIAEKRSSTMANSSLLLSDSAVTFGRTHFDWNSLYITSAGTTSAGNGSMEGRVIRVDLPYTCTDFSF